MKEIVVMSCSIREGRKTHKVAEFLSKELNKKEGYKMNLVDLKEVNLPMFTEKLDESEYPENLKKFSDAIVNSDGIIVVCPEYKNNIPGVLKNAWDFLKPQVFNRIPMANITLGSNSFGGPNCLSTLRLLELNMGGVPTPQKCYLNIQEIFDENGHLLESVLIEKTAYILDNYWWYVERLSQ